MKPNTFSTPLRGAYFGTPSLTSATSATSQLPRVDPKDLEELIGSLGIDLYTPARSKDIVKSILDSDTKVRRFYCYMNNCLFTLLHLVIMLFIKIQARYDNIGTAIDHSGEDVTAVHYGTKFSLRGAFGRYLGAVPSSVETPGQDASTTTDSVSYLLDASGMGLGDELESFEFVSIDGGAADGDALTYGSLVAIKVSRARERYSDSFISDLSTPCYDYNFYLCFWIGCLACEMALDWASGAT